MAQAQYASSYFLEKMENQMPYHINADHIRLEELQRRIEASDLVPSRSSLLNELNKKMNQIKKQGISTLTELRIAIKTPKRIDSLAQDTGIDKDFFVLLRREIESYFPKPFSLTSFDWLPQDEIKELAKEGIENTAQFYVYFQEKNKKEDFKASSQMNEEVYNQLMCLCDLTRIQWTSPLAARMLFDAGYHSVRMVALSDPEILFNALTKINKRDQYFKGNIGLRDIKRLINSASYLTK